MLGERNQTLGHILYNPIYTEYSKQANPQIQTAVQWFPWDERREEWGETANGYEISFQGDENILN